MIHLAITDDHPLLVNGIESALSRASGLKLEASFTDGRQTLDNFAHYKIDVLLLDINLPDIDGIKLCKILMDKYQHLKIIGLTSHKETAFLKNLLKSGAKGFLLKNSPVEEILEAVHLVYYGDQYIQQEMKELLLAETLHTTSNTAFIPKLTRREKDVLRLISEEFTTREIAEKLFLSTKTVETHRQNLILKLGAKNAVGLVKTAIEKGLL